MRRTRKELTLVHRGITFPYTLRTVRRAKYIRISVHADGRVVVTKPYWVPQYAAKQFVEEKRKWIAKELQLTDPESVNRKRKEDHAVYIKYKETARAFVHERVEYWNRMYNFAYNRIAIRNQKTCWGSCTAKKNLNFSYWLLHLPEHLADYVIVHELCHLQELNHSPRFWTLVAETLPDHQALRNELRSIQR